MSNHPITLPATVVFDVWGQRSETVFDETSELDPITWLRTCYDYGFLAPVEILSADGVVLYSQDDLRGMIRVE